MWGDPHIGGPTNWDDDLSFFDRELNMVYCWDADNISDVSGKVPGYFGYKFLESQGNLMVVLIMTMMAWSMNVKIMVLMRMVIGI